jgi:hypothetical protein
MGATILLIGQVWRRFFFWKVDFIVVEIGRWSVMRI